MLYFKSFWVSYLHALLFYCSSYGCLDRIEFMEGTRSGRGRGHRSRQPTTDRGAGKTSVGPNPEPKVDPTSK